MLNREVRVLDHGYVKLRNIAGPTRRPDAEFDASDVDPANSARISFDQSDDPDRTEEADLKLYEFLIKRRHTTPIEMIETWWEMKMPIFIARQFVRHRTVTINEMSARYVQLPKEFYIPNPATVGHKGATQKQGRIVGEETENARIFCEYLRTHCESTYEMYTVAVAQGIPHELARSMLPLNIYTKWIWKQNLHNLMHFLSLRVEEHAQFEAREYANAMILVLDHVLPKSMELFDKYRRIKE